MDSEALKQQMDRFPVVPILVLYLVYIVGYDYYYSFLQNNSSPLNQTIGQISQFKKENLNLKDKIKQAEEFQKNLEVKRQELQSLSLELENMKSTLTVGLDVPDFMKMIITEAKKVGLVVLAMKPTGGGKKENYAEHAFELSFRGAYIQLLGFLNRVSQSQRVIQVDNFLIKPKGSTKAKYVELEGTIQIKTFSYVGSQVDEIAKKNPAKAQDEKR